MAEEQLREVLALLPAPATNSPAATAADDGESRGLRLQALFDLGVLLANRGRHAEAVLPLRQALALAKARRQRMPTHALALELGLALLQTGQYAEAAAQLSLALRSFPDMAVLHHSLGLAQLELGAVAEAEQALERAVQLSPGVAASWLALAELQLDSQRQAAALQTCQRGLQALPRCAALHLRVARVQQAAGNLRLAREACVRALQLDRTLDDARELQEELSMETVGCHALVVAAASRTSAFNDDASAVYRALVDVDGAALPPANVVVLPASTATPDVSMVVVSTLFQRECSPTGILTATLSPNPAACHGQAAAAC